MKIISVYSHFKNVGGAQKVCLDVHYGLLELNKDSQGFVSSFDDYKTIDSKYIKRISKDDFIKFSAYKLIKKYTNFIFISHHRKTTTFLVATAKLLKKKIKIIHVAHNEFSTLKRFTFLPENIVAVSQKVKDNHMKYFNLEPKSITVIFNGFKPEKSIIRNKKFDKKNIIIGLPGRITEVKQQVEIVKFLKNELQTYIHIVFAGDGIMLPQLKSLIKQDNRFEALGLIENMTEFYENLDFVLLFSKKEGLPLSLIEAQAYGIPIICNDVGGNLEILEDKHNGFLVNSFNELAETLNNIVELKEMEYERLSKNSIGVFNKKFSFNKMIKSYDTYIKERF